MRAFVAYWVLLGVTVVAWIAATMAFPGEDGIVRALKQPGWLAILLVPPALAGIDLIAYRDRHEEVCRLEARRHRWLRSMVGDGYSARTFALTGIAMLAGVIAVAVFGALAPA